MSHSVVRRRKDLLANLPARSLLFVYSIIVAYPLLWMVMSSLKNTKEIYANPWALPETWALENYLTAWNYGISQYFINSVIVTVATTALTILIAALCAFGLSRVPGRVTNTLLLVCIGGLLVSPQVSLVPLYQLIQSMHLHDTYWAMILPYVAYRLPMAVLLLRSVFLSLPRELDDAATMDGCSSWALLWKVYIPLSKSVLITVGVLTAYFAWNEFLFALIFVDSDALRTIPAGLMNFRDSLSTNWGVLLAGLVIAAAPIVAVFIAMQRFFVAGATSGSIKG